MTRMQLANKVQETGRGQALVEFALVLPFLLMLIVLVFEGVMVFRTQMVLIQAAREGAMYASINPPDSPRFELTNLSESGYEDRIQKVMEEAGLDINDAEIALPTGSGNPGEPISVEVKYELETFLSRFRNPFTGEFLVPGGKWNLSYKMAVPVR